VRSNIEVDVHSWVLWLSVVDKGCFDVDRKSNGEGNRADNTAVAEQLIQCTLWHTTVILMH